MNMHAPLSTYPAGAVHVAPAMTDFAPPHPVQRRNRMRVAGFAGVLAVHGLLLLAYFFGGPAFVHVAAQQHLTVVNVLAEPPKPLEPPPLPTLARPVVYVPVPVVPEIQLAVPPPPHETITIPPAPISSPPDAPFVPAAPAPSVPKPALSASDQAAFAARLFAHLNRFKRYPETAKLRHQEGVVSLRFTMDRTGRVLTFDIAKSSGSAALDAEAHELIQRAQPLPPLPAEFGRDSLDLVVPVEFYLH
ncbi:MAG TPA: energy transducer TonB [Micropepsaceae bacterium]|jgi:protein TonB|nr:energy transducer TonB [Micropepsaceae bacterium]